MFIHFFQVMSGYSYTLFRISLLTFELSTEALEGSDPLVKVSGRLLTTNHSASDTRQGGQTLPAAQMKAQKWARLF